MVEHYKNNSKVIILHLFVDILGNNIRLRSYINLNNIVLFSEKLKKKHLIDIKRTICHFFLSIVKNQRNCVLHYTR